MLAVRVAQYQEPSAILLLLVRLELLLRPVLLRLGLLEVQADRVPWAAAV